jgi:ABC-type transport system substrate-binding protein
MRHSTVLWVLMVGLLALSCNPYPYPGERGSVMHVAIRLLPKSLDPPHIEDAGSGQLGAKVYEGLVKYHPFARPYRLEPAMAAAMPEVSDDQLTYTFRLREGIRFADDACFEDGRGREVVADDFLYAFKRFAHPSTHAQGWWLFDGWIAGLNEWRDAVGELVDAEAEAGRDPGPLHGLDRPVAGFEVVDDHTFRIRLTRPYPQLMWVLAMPYTGVYPHEAVEFYGEQFRTHPVGTGPYRVTEFNPVYRMVFTRNENYRDVRVPDPVNDAQQRWPGWEEDVEAGFLVDAGAQVPLTDGMEVRFILEDQPRWLYFKTGYVDFIFPPKDNVAEALPGGELSPMLKERGVKVTPWPELGTVYTSLNTTDPMFSNVNLRRAVAVAFDHRWTVDHLYAGQAVVATSPVPPGVAGFDPDYHPYHTPDGTPDYERAKEFLVEAGYPGGVDSATGKPLRITFEQSGSSVTNRHFSQRFRDDMRRIGVDVDVVVNTFPQMIAKMRKGQFQVAGLAWGFDYPDSQNVLQLLYGPNKSPGINSANFDNPEFNALYERAAVLEDSPERTELYREMTHIVADEVPWITRAHRIRQALQHPWLRGFKYTEVNYGYWAYAGIDAEARRERLAEWNRPTRWPLFLMLGIVGMLVGATVWGRRRPQ